MARDKNQRERSAEVKLREGVKKLGGMALKMVPTVSGIPDRLVLLPGGRVCFIELKRESGGRLSPIQEVQIGRLRAMGHEVFVLRGTTEVAEWLSSL